MRLTLCALLTLLLCAAAREIIVGENEGWSLGVEYGALQAQPGDSLVRGKWRWASEACYGRGLWLTKVPAMPWTASPFAVNSPENPRIDHCPLNQGTEGICKGGREGLVGGQRAGGRPGSRPDVLEASSRK